MLKAFLVKLIALSFRQFLTTLRLPQIWGNLSGTERVKSLSRHDIVLKSVNYAEFKAISCRLSEQELQLLFQFIIRSFVKKINYDFYFFFEKK
jgi:hypothetical protein